MIDALLSSLLAGRWSEGVTSVMMLFVSYYVFAVCAAWLVRRSECAVVKRGDLAQLADSLRQ